jgi:hypothetical protein
VPSAAVNQRRAMALSADRNVTGVAVGGFTGSSPAIWEGGFNYYYEEGCSIIPDPRLGLPSGDCLTFESGIFTAINDAGQIQGFGTLVDQYGNTVGGEFDLMYGLPATFPEPSTFLLLATFGAHQK